MVDRNLARGIFLSGIALAFGLSSLQYKLGKLSNAGPGLFPLMVSGLLLLIGILTIIQARLSAREPMEIQIKNISIILGSLCGFALVSHFVNMIAGIVVLVFCSAFAASSFSWFRSVKVAAGLIAVAFAFQKGLGLNLPLL